MPRLAEPSDPVDNVFRALADPTRRRVLERLSSSPASVSDLAAPFEIALPSFVQHMSVLEDCGLVQSQKKGRVRTYEIVPEQLSLAQDWLAQQRDLWQRRLDQFDAYASQLKEQQP